MAPVNPGYSNTAQSLKMHFINALDTSKQHHLLPTGLSISSFCVRVSELWEALLKENFVFSFRNTQEISLYTSLEVEYTKWNRSFMKNVIEWESDVSNDINFADLSEISQVRKTIITDLGIKIDIFYNESASDMNKYFEDKQGIILKWKDEFKLKLYRQKNNLYQRSEKRLNDLIEAKEALVSFEQKKQKIVDEIKLSVQNSIDNIKKEQKELKTALEEKKFSDSQIRTLNKRKMFTRDKMEIYANLGVSPTALREIEVIKQHNQGELSNRGLTHILCYSLSLDEVHIILKQSSQSKSKKELEDDFEVIWKEFIEKVPKFQSIKPCKIEAEVETALIEYVGPQGGDTKLKDMLLQKPLKDYKEDDLTFKITDSHFSILGYRPPEGKFQKVVSKLKKFRFYDDNYFETVEEITTNIFFLTKLYGNEIAQRKINFSPALVIELLHYIEEIISSEAYEQDFDIQFTHQYKHEVYIRLCAFMIPHFEKMAKSFAHRCDPRRHLEKIEKKPLFIKYQNQYQQIETEEAVARTLCAYLEEQIKNKVKRKLGSLIASKMSKETSFSDKRALKVQVLIDLLNKNDFDSYMVFIKDIKKCLTDHIQKYILEFCDRKAENSCYSELQEAASEVATQIMETISTIVIKPIPDNTTLEQWLSAVCRNLNFSKIGIKLKTNHIICDYESSFKLDQKNFQKNVRDHLHQLKERVLKSFRACKAISEIEILGCSA